MFGWETTSRILSEGYHLIGRCFFGELEAQKCCVPNDGEAPVNGDSVLVSMKPSFKTTPPPAGIVFGASVFVVGLEEEPKDR